LPSTVRLRWANAGHPPPILVHRDGTVETLAGTDLLLGATQLTRRATHERLLPPAATLITFTDGLIERRDRHFDVVTEDLHALLADRAAAPPDDLVDLVLETVPARNHEDDVALIAVRTDNLV
jgi:serine phosphatase RsbU (regulator of sigma subunit)